MNRKEKQKKCNVLQRAYPNWWRWLHVSARSLEEKEKGKREKGKQKERTKQGGAGAN